MTINREHYCHITAYALKFFKTCASQTKHISGRIWEKSRLLACFIQPGLGSPTQLIFLHPDRFLSAAVLLKWLLLLFKAFVTICKAVCLCYWQKFSIKIPIFPPTSTLFINCAEFLSLHAARQCVGCLCVSFLTFPVTATPKPIYKRNKELFWLGQSSTHTCSYSPASCTELFIRQCFEITLLHTLAGHSGLKFQ